MANDKPAETKLAPISLNLQPFGEIRTFDKIEELEKWLDTEQAAWNPVASVYSQHSGTPGQAAWAATANRLQQLRGFTQRYREQTQKGLAVAQARDELNRQIATLFPTVRGNELYIPTSSPAFKFIESAVAEDKLRGGFAFASLLRLAWSQHGLRYENFFHNDPNPVFGGAVDAEMFRRGIKARTSGEASALAQLRQEWVDELRKHKELYATEVSAARVDIEKRNQAEKEHDEKFDKVIAAGDQQLKDELATRKKQFDTLYETYNKRLALESSVRYWRHRGHWSTGLTVLLFVVVVVSAGGLVWYLEQTVDRIVTASATATTAQVAQSPSATAAQAAPTAGAPAATTPAPVQIMAPTPAAAAAPAPAATVAPPPPWFRFWIAPVIFLLGAWVIRMLSRLLYASFAAAAASYEKATMVESFLALMKDSGGLPAETIAALLPAVFHQPRTSLEGEPIVDPGLTNAVASLAKGMKGS